MLEKVKDKVAVVTAPVMIGIMNMQVAYADNGTAKIDSLLSGFIAPWLAKIGGVVCIVGGVMFALGWQREDAEGKTRGLQTLAAGAMVIGISASYTMFM